ncbi:hypothetical protein BN1723_006914, partial [Verticillium longisporum]
MMPPSQMLSPDLQITRVLAAGIEPKASSRPGSPKVKTTTEHPLRTILVLGHWLAAWCTVSSLSLHSCRDTGRNYPGGEIGHGPAASGITSGEETEHVGRVVHTLDGQVGGTDLLSKGIEEDGADGRRVTDVAVLR